MAKDMDWIDLELNKIKGWLQEKLSGISILMQISIKDLDDLRNKLKTVPNFTILQLEMKRSLEKLQTHSKNMMSIDTSLNITYDNLSKKLKKL